MTRRGGWTSRWSCSAAVRTRSASSASARPAWALRWSACTAVWWSCAMAYDEQLAERVRDLLNARAAVTEKKMFGGVAWMINGNMAVGASSKGALIVRVEPEETAALLEDLHVSE